MRYLLGFFRNLWRGLDALRRVLHLLLLLGLLALAMAALRGSIPRLPERGALVIHPSGEIVEQLAGAPLERALSEAQGQSAPQTLLWDLTRAIRGAATDARIQALLIETDDLSGAGLPQLEELARGDRRISRHRQEGRRPRQLLPAEPVLPRGPGRRGLSRSVRIRAAAGFRPLSHVLQGCDR